MPHTSELYPSLSTASVWRRTHAWGAKLREHSEAERAQANALPEKWEPPSRRVVPDQRMDVAMDGTMIHIGEEGWKELKVGTVFDVAVRLTRDERTGDLVDLGHAVRNAYVAHLGGPEILGELVWTEGRRRKWEEAQDTLELTEKARRFLADAGYDPVYGARPLKRAVQRHLQDPLALALLRGDFGEGNTIIADVSGDKLAFRKRIEADVV